MSLLTPPGTAHRNKENRRPTASASSRVVWSQSNQYHTVTSSPPRHLSVPASALRERPTRSILKKSQFKLLPVPDASAREITPEPSDPLADLHYLDHPVATIVDPNASLRDIVEAYSVLTARLRAAVTDRTDADPSWPLFQPLRKHRQELVQSFERDLGRALVDPSTLGFSETSEKKSCLPSPKPSPKKKRDGMSEEQVKFARDVHTVCLAALRLLSLVFTLPAVYGVFTDAHLHTSLTAVLAIPLATELPTPNARKTYALAIWLLQTQRLPTKVLAPAKTRIAVALRRGIEGELGKEGKKGSASDGLKAIHDLSISNPPVFVVAFADLLPSILANLLAPTLTLRALACHALGGLVLASTTLPVSQVHTRISTHIANFLTAPSPASRKTSPSGSPAKVSASAPSSPSQDSPIVRTIRTTLQATEPQHPAQGPVWGLCVLANLLVLLRSRVYTDPRLNRTFTGLFALAMRHKKSSVRGVCCLVWRCVTWSYFQPPLPPADVDSEEEGDEDPVRVKKYNASVLTARERFWVMVKSMPEMGAGVATIAALLADDCDSRSDEQALQRVFDLLRAMVKKSRMLCAYAVDVLDQMLAPYTFADPDAYPDLEARGAAPREWSWPKLLSPALFNTCPGLLTADYKTLAGAVRPAFDQGVVIEDVRWLTKEEASTGWVFEGIVGVWKQAFVSSVWGRDIQDIPVERLRVWEGLLRANVEMWQESGQDDQIPHLAGRAAGILVELLQDPTFCLDTASTSNADDLPSSPVDTDEILAPAVQSVPLSALAMKFWILRALWKIMHKLIPRPDLVAAGEKVLAGLMSHRGGLDCIDDARDHWSHFCADVLVVCDADQLRMFCCALGGDAGDEMHEPGWEWSPEIRCGVWRDVAATCIEDKEATWEGSVALLSAPLSRPGAWDMSSADVEAWKALASHAMAVAADYGHDSSAVLNDIAAAIASGRTTSASYAKAAELLVSHVDMEGLRECPRDLLDFVNATLSGSYPPSTEDKPACSYLIWTVTRAIQHCPEELVAEVMEAVQEGLSTWIADEYKSLADAEYALDILSLYEAVVCRILDLPCSMDVLERFADLLQSAFLGRDDKPAAMDQTFRDFWSGAYENAVLGQPLPRKIEHCVVTISRGTRVVDTAEDASTSAQGASDVDATVAVPMSDAASDTDDDEPLSFPDSDDDEDVPLSNAPRLGPAFAPKRPSSPEASAAAVPSTPRNVARHIACTPPRPSKALLTFPSSTFTFRSPGSPLRPSPAVTSRRTPALRAKGQTRLGADKENASPITVLDRIAAASVGSPTKSAKRRMLAEEDEPTAYERPVGDCHTPKRMKFAFGASAGPSPIVNRVAIEENRAFNKAALLGDRMKGTSARTSHNPAGSPSDKFMELHTEERNELEAETPSKPTKKRKRVFMTAVVVPTLRCVQALNRKRQILARVSAAAVARHVRPAPEVEQTPKRRRLFGPRASDDDSEPSSSSPIRSLLDVMIGSDDSIMQADEEREVQVLLSSSDDDRGAYVGQVTPSHVVSPTLRRSRAELDRDAPSDDSVMAASPSRDHVARRLGRTSSFARLDLAPFVLGTQ